MTLKLLVRDHILKGKAVIFLPTSCSLYLPWTGMEKREESIQFS